jgi:tetratricopeptide (TPR) repeat protein
MEHQATPNYCPDGKISALVAAAGSDARRGIRDLETMLKDYPGDARLHFLKGSLLAGEQDYSAARLSMRHAVDLAPDYHVARFQLGFLLLTSGEPHAAQEAWGPLHSLPSDHYLRMFVNGLCHLIRDEFADAIKLLKKGIVLNNENPPMNRDMQLIIEQVTRQMDQAGGGAEGSLSSVDFLLQQSALKPKR